MQIKAFESYLKLSTISFYSDSKTSNINFKNVFIYSFTCFIVNLQL